MDLIKVWEIIDQHLDFDAMWKRAIGFHNHEKYMGFKNWRLSAKHGIKEFKKAGARLEIIETPADGKTAALDHVMPMGWDCDFAKVEILGNNGTSDLLVDSISQPICIAPFSPPTPKEGLIAEVVHEYSYGKTPWEGKIILSTSNPEETSRLKEKINKTGAIGVLCSWNTPSLAELDSHQFLNNFTTGPGWYPTADERPVILFSISIRQGKKLSDRMTTGRTYLRITVQGKLGKDSFLTVSGAIPGAKRELAEVLAIAHMYEPFPTDDASGSSGAVEIIAAIQRAIKSGDLPRPKRTIRSLLMWEQYGLSYFFEKCRKQNRRFLAAINMDCAGQALYAGPINLIYSGATVPWGGNFPWLELTHQVLHKKCGDKYQYRDIRGHYGDDCFLSQPAYGVPTLWMYKPSTNYHHNTQITWDKVDPDLYRAGVGTAAAYLYAMACAGEKEGYKWAKDILAIAGENIGGLLKSDNINCEKIKFEADYHARCVESLIRFEEYPKTTYNQYLKNISAKIHRLTPKCKARPVLSPMMIRAKDWVVKLSDPGCLPYDLAKIPFQKRRKFVAQPILNWCDGKKDLAEALRLTGLENNRSFTDQKIRQIMRDLRFLAEAGYVDIQESTIVGEKDFITALKRAGIKNGDTLFVHSSLFPLGKIKHGAATVVSAIRAAVGREALISMPTYTNCDYRAGDGRPDVEDVIPFDPEKSPANTGVLADYFWRQKGVLRGTNPVHSTAAQGPGASEFLEGDNESIPCCSLAGPLGKMLVKNGKFVFLGAGMSCCTFLHAIEDACDLPYLTTGQALAAEGDVIRDIPMLLFPAGPREFYKEPDNECFRKLHKSGLKKKVAKIGLGKIEVVSARNLAVAALKMLAEDPLAIVCDDTFNPLKTRYAESCKKKAGRIRKLLHLAQSGKWEELIKQAVLKQ